MEKIGSHETVQQTVGNESIHFNSFLIHENEQVEQVLDVSFPCNDAKHKASIVELCQHIICCDFIGNQHLPDMFCNSSSNEYKQVHKMYMVYCRMSIQTPEPFLMALFDFNSDEDNAFNTACCTVFHAMLNIVYQE